MMVYKYPNADNLIFACLVPLIHCFSGYSFKLGKTKKDEYPERKL